LIPWDEICNLYLKKVRIKATGRATINPRIAIGSIIIKLTYNLDDWETVESICDRHSHSSTIIVSQIPVSVWYGILGEGTIADAILDRIVNSSHRIYLKGESLRKEVLKSEN
jgi:DNA replication protein DnaC